MFTIFDFLIYKLNPYGSWTALAYSQYDFSFISIWASIFGIWGISFMISWTASVLCWLYINKQKINFKKFNKNLQYLTLYLVIISSLFTFSLVQSFSKNDVESGKKVKISAISVNDTIYGYNDEIMDKLFEETEKSAKNGTKIISWAEANGLVTEENLEKYLQKSSQIAKKYELYFFPTFWVKSSTKLTKNQVFGFNSKGEQILEYNKNQPLPNEKIFRGDGKIPVVDTSYGKIAVAICFDNDHPELIRQTSKNQVDILLSPSRDWKQINPKHSYIISFRSIENGLITIKATNFGDSVIWDKKGKVIAQNKFTSENYEMRVLESTIKVERDKTLYSKIGDSVIWLSCFLVFIFTILRLTNQKFILN